MHHDKLFVDERPIGFGRVEQVTPRSWAARMSLIISCLSAGGP
jgi:hypothetical protein